jgi:protein-S-isoprenylcysteine O-methyltransferase Ste14
MSEQSQKSRWWEGARGEWYVVAQALLFVLVALGPRRVGDPLVWPWARAATGAGVLLMVAGAGLLLAALFKLGRNLTPLPYPKQGGALVQTGPYRVVRHPIYSGGLALAFGWAFCVHGELTLAYAVALFVLFDVKSRREERWLVAKFPDYRNYQQRIRRLIPFVY